MSSAQTLKQKLTALGVLAALFVGALGLAIAPYMRLLTLFDQTAAAQDLVDTLNRRVSSQAKLSEGRINGAAARPEDVFVVGETTGIAGADLQRRLVELISSKGGNVKALLVLPPAQGAKANLVSVNVVANVPFKELQDILYDIETSTPLLFVDDISINVPEGLQGGRVTNGPLRVEVTMLVSGYRSMGPQS